MQLEHMTWYEVDERLSNGCAAMLPVGSTEQHGPIGRIGTDTICAGAVALRAADLCDAIVAPALAYTPAPFNAAFPGTVSVTPDVFTLYAREIIEGLLAQGFSGVFIVNGHGANIAPLQAISADLPPNALITRSWWEPEPVNALRRTLYGEWEGMHATPSEVAITQSLLGVITDERAEEPPQKLTPQYLRDHSGDRHGPPDEHRAEFPDGRVGSHSALATPTDGARLLEMAAQAISREFLDFQKARKQS